MEPATEIDYQARALQHAKTAGFHYQDEPGILETVAAVVADTVAHAAETGGVPDVQMCWKSS